MIGTSNLILIVTLLSGCNYVLSCQLKIHGQSPIFTKNFGSKRIVFKGHENQLSLEEGETIKAYCRGITIFTHSSREYENVMMISNSATDDVAVFTCESNILTFLGNSYDSLLIACPNYPCPSLYESNKKLLKCSKFMNYAIGVKLQESDDVIKAGICYDLDKLELKFASYVAYDKKVLFFNKQLQVGNELGLNLKQELSGFNKYFDFVNLQSKVLLQPLAKSSFNAMEFHFDSLLQDERLKTELEDFKYIFNIMWWRQLSQENWHFFLDALRERTQTVKYVVHVGTYGNVTIPTTQGNCSSFKNQVVSIGNEDMVVKAPGYIWAYLKSITPGEEEEFVVIGHNSPYKKNPDHSEFCATDICDDYDWLKNSQFGSLRQLPTLGYTFCCRPEEVSNIIDYFPLKATEITTITP